VNQIRNLFIFLILSLSLSGNVMADSIGPELKINRANGDECVLPAEEIRKDHMKHLNHQRDDTMYDGIRTKQFSLKECINCHANKDEEGKYIPVNAPGEFCQTCHAYTSVKLDCFECHATKPRDTAFHPIVTDKMKAFVEVHETPNTKSMLDAIAIKNGAK